MCTPIRNISEFGAPVSRITLCSKVGSKQATLESQQPKGTQICSLKCGWVHNIERTASFTDHFQNLVSFLRPEDVITLTTCQVLHAQIRLDDAKAKANLLTKTLCPELGLAMRKMGHCRCKTRLWHKFVGCAGEGYDARSKACAACGINTCDECRIHVLYQVFV